MVHDTADETIADTARATRRIADPGETGQGRLIADLTGFTENHCRAGNSRFEAPDGILSQGICKTRAGAVISTDQHQHAAFTKTPRNMAPVRGHGRESGLGAKDRQIKARCIIGRAGGKATTQRVGGNGASVACGLQGLYRAHGSDDLVMRTPLQADRAKIARPDLDRTLPRLHHGCEVVGNKVVLNTATLERQAADFSGRQCLRQGHGVFHS